MMMPIGDLTLERGGVLRDAGIAFTTYGNPAPDGRNAVLLTHGYTSSHMFADGGPSASEGAWGGLVGPGRAIDTDRFFVVSSNMLGSSFGSTAPRSIDPATGRAYGPDFPVITLKDIVSAQHALLRALGVTSLAAVVGPSYGGFQAFAWGMYFSDFVRALVPVVTGPRAPGSDMDALERRLATDPNWNGGHYYAAGGVLETMTQIRFETLRRYGVTVGEAALRATARAWAEAFDAHSLLVLGRAANAFDATAALSGFRVPVLYVLSRTDALFPPSLAPGVMAAFASGGVDARYVEIDSEAGHLASGVDWAMWADELAAFMGRIPA
jgi:homoserine O-acetyltransferase